jgi:hypothetical protein
MPQLQEDPATLGMDRINDTPPSGDLTIRIDAGRAGIAVAADRDRRRLRNDEAAARRALGIVLDNHVARNLARIGAHPRQRRHHDTMGQMIRAKFKRREECGHRHNDMNMPES